MKKILVLFMSIILISSLTACNITIRPLSNKDPAPVVEAEQAPEPAPVKIDYIKPGTYECGVDLDAGEYVLIETTKNSGFYEHTYDNTGDASSIISNGWCISRMIITIKPGEYFTFESGEMYPIDYAPPVDLSSGKLKAGMYLVGKDFEAGEYKLIPDKNASQGGLAIISSDSRNDYSSNIVNEFFETEIYLTVKDGQYLKMHRCVLIL